MSEDRYGYRLDRSGVTSQKKGTLYQKNDIELMTTHQLREICRQEKIIHGVVNLLDKDELVRTILRYRGAERHPFICRERREGREALQKLLQQANIRLCSDLQLEGSAKITVYRGRRVRYYDKFMLNYEPRVAETNALVVSRDRKLCGILNVERIEQDSEVLYLTKAAEIVCEEAAVRNYDLYCMDQKTSELIWDIYEGHCAVLPEKLAFYRVKLVDFIVRDPVELDMPLVLDFGASGTTAGIYLDEQFFEQTGIGQDEGGKWKKDSVNIVPFFDPEHGYRESPRLPSTAAALSLENQEYPLLLFGYEALRELGANYADEGFCVHYDIRRWLSNPDGEAEFIDRQGNRAFISRRLVLREYLLCMIRSAENYFKCVIHSVHITCPLKKYAVFQRVYQELLPEYHIDALDSLDEGTSVLYGIEARLLEKQKLHMRETYKALIIDCGGSSTDMSSYTFCVQNQQAAYHIAIDSTYRDGDMDFGGNSITCRILQLLKIQLWQAIDQPAESSLDAVMEGFAANIYRRVDEHGAAMLYAPFEALYDQAEARIPTRFKEWEKLNRSDYYRVKNNYFFLFRLAEQVKHHLFDQGRTLSVSLSSERLPGVVWVDKWKINVRDRAGGLQALRDFPTLQVSSIDVTQLLKADIYSLIRRFIEPMYQSGELDEYAIIKLCGQSCRIDIFRDAVSEFLPGRRIETDRRQDGDRSYEMKLACLKGAVTYLRDRRYGYADVRLTKHFLQIPYQVTGYMHTRQELVLIDGTDWEGKHGMISRNMDDLTLQLTLKDMAGQVRCTFTYSCQLSELEPSTYEAIASSYGAHIPQADTDDIVDREIRFFVWAEPLQWGFRVVPICRYGEELCLGRGQIFYFENESWLKGAFDGLK